MITSSQFDALNSRFVSHVCRSLFIFEIEPQADSSGRYVIDYNRLTQELSVFNPEGELYFKPSEDNITRYLKQLLEINLISINENQADLIEKNQSFHGITINIVQKKFSGEIPSNQNIPPEAIFPMSENWYPSPRFSELSRTAMLVNNSYSDEDLAEFRSYWMSRPAMRCSAFIWDQKFISHLKRFHTLMQNKVPVYRGQVGLQRK